MNVNGAGIYNEMQSMIRQVQGGDAQPMQVQNNQAQNRFADLLQDAVNNVNSLQKQSANMATRIEMGDRSVSLGDSMIAAQKSSIAFQATLQVRNKLVEAYKEIMSMPV